MRTDAPDYPYKRNPLCFEDVALGASLRWVISEAAALKYLKGRFNDPGDALDHLKQHDIPPDEFWQSL